MPGLRRLLLGLAILCPLYAAAANAEIGGIAVVRAAPWSPGDEVREGAGEFEVLFRVASMQNNHRAVGVLGIGDRHGSFPTGAERALRFLAMRGMPVARIALGGDSGLDPEGLFLDAGHLSESQATAILGRCLERFGAAPVVADPEHPTSRELAATRNYLSPFRQAFAVATAPRLTNN
jgi:hypothetical protein